MAQRRKKAVSGRVPLLPKGPGQGDTTACWQGRSPVCSGSGTPEVLTGALEGRRPPHLDTDTARQPVSR